MIFGQAARCKGCIGLTLAHQQHSVRIPRQTVNVTGLNSLAVSKDSVPVVVRFILLTLHTHDNVAFEVNVSFIWHDKGAVKGDQAGRPLTDLSFHAKKVGQMDFVLAGVRDAVLVFISDASCLLLKDSSQDLII
jgi:hypothetical protein